MNESGNNSSAGNKLLPNLSKLCLICTVRNAIIGLPIDELLGVQRISAGVTLPDTPPFISGLHSLNNGLFVGIDIGILLGGSAILFDSTSRAILVEEEGVKAVLLVDAIQSIDALELETEVKTSTHSNHDLIHFTTCCWRGNSIDVYDAIKIIKYAKDHSFDVIKVA